MKAAVLVTRLENIEPGKAISEERQILLAFRSLGLDPLTLLQTELQPDTTNQAQMPDVVVNRVMSLEASILAGYYLESKGIPVITATRTIEVCGNKSLTQFALERKGIPTPRAVLAFTPESAMRAIERLGYYCVYKPNTGSWARAVGLIETKNAARLVVELIKTFGNVELTNGFYFQEYIQKPGVERQFRDIRAFVSGGKGQPYKVIGAIYRNSDDWTTNTARGAIATVCPVDDGLIKICIAAAKAVGGGGVLGIDVFECPDPNGYLLIKDQRYIYKINEINGTTQFKNSSGPIGIDLADYIARYAIQQARISARSR